MYVSLRGLFNSQAGQLCGSIWTTRDRDGYFVSIVSILVSSAGTDRRDAHVHRTLRFRLARRGTVAFSCMLRGPPPRSTFPTLPSLCL